MSPRTLIIITILLAVAVICVNGTFTEVLATNNACAYTTNHMATIFNAPQNGIISGIKAVYSHGSAINCNTGFCPSTQAKWGCHCWDDRRFMIEMMQVTNASNYAGITIYPTISTTGYISIETTSCSRGCTQGLYEMNGQSLYNNTILWDGATYEITTNDQFMLQCAEGCCYSNVGDNEGYVCAQIYFLYAPTNSPTTAPSVSPSNAPSSSPTNAPFPQVPGVWISRSPTMPKSDARMAIGHHDNTIDIIGGTVAESPRSLMEFDVKIGRAHV